MKTSRYTRLAFFDPPLICLSLRKRDFFILYNYSLMSIVYICMDRSRLCPILKHPCIVVSSPVRDPRIRAAGFLARLDAYWTCDGIRNYVQGSRVRLHFCLTNHQFLQSLKIQGFIRMNRDVPKRISVRARTSPRLYTVAFRTRFSLP